MSHWMYVTDIFHTAQQVVNVIIYMDLISQVFSSVSAPDTCSMPHDFNHLQDFLYCNQMRTMKTNALLILFLGLYFISSMSYYITKVILKIKSGFKQINTSINSNNQNMVNNVDIQGASTFIAVPT